MKPSVLLRLLGYFLGNTGSQNYTIGLLTCCLGWWCSIVVRATVLACELSLSCARLMAAV